MSSSPKVPSPPGLSPQELELINQQKMTLEQFNKLLSQETIGSKETQNILKDLSGLYSAVDIPETRGPERRETVADMDKFSQVSSFGEQARKAYFDAQAAGTPITEQQAIESLRGVVPSQFIDRVLKSNPLQNSRLKEGDRIINAFETAARGVDPLSLGFTKENVIQGDIIPGRREMQLNQTAVDDLRKRIQDNIAYQDSLAARDKEIEAKAGSILDQLLNRQALALEGKLPVDPAITESKNREFQGVAENLRRRGYDIIGDDPDTAVAIGTPAVQTLDAFKKRYNLVEDASRRGELDSATGRNIGAAGLVSDLRTSSTYNPALTSLGFLQQGQASGPAGLLGMYPSLTTGYGQTMAPYAALRNSQYNSSVQNAALSSQNRGGLLALSGMGLASGNPWLMGAGGVGALIGLMSSKKLKKNIVKLTAKQENKMLNLVRKGDVYTFDYKDEKHGEGKRVGIIAEEAPAELVTKDRKAQDVGNTLNILLTSVRALDRKVERLRLTRRAA